MAISDRITSMEEHIKESYQELEGIGIDTTGVNKNLENIPKLIDGYWETLPKVTGEGTSITLDNTKEGKMKIDLKGNTSQETYEGYNLFGQKVLTIGGVYEYYQFKELDDDSEYTLSIKLKDGGTQQNMYVGLANETSQLQTYSWLMNNGNINIGVLQPDGFRSIVNHFSGKYVSYLVIYRNNISLKNLFDNYDIQLVEGSTYKPYQEYVGGTASPNPDYPQDIHVVSGDNSIEVVGKNLLQLPNVSTTSNGVTSTITNGKLKIVGTTTTNWFSICNLNIPLESGTYIFSYTNKKVNRYNFSIKYEDNTTQVIYGNAYSNTPITLNKNATIIAMFSDNNTTGATFDYEDYLMLEKGSTATTYEEYKGASYPISLGDIELCKIGTYQDSIVKDNGKWYLNKQIGKYNNPIWKKGSSSNVNVFYSTSINNYATSNNIPLSNNFIGVTNVRSEQDMRNQIGKIAFRDSQQYIRLYVSSNMTEAELNNLNTVIYYLLDTPTYTEITDSTLLSQLNALAKSYEGQTNISQESNDLASILNATALEEME